MSYDRLIRLAGQLPIKSRTMKKVHGLHASWDIEYLVAALIDAVRENSWITLNVNVSPNKRSKFPDKFYRPGDKIADKGSKEISRETLDKLLKQKEALNGST